MSINSFNPLPSIKPSGTADASGGSKAAISSTTAAPNGDEFSVYFERMMHPAFSAASKPQGSSVGQANTSPLNALTSRTSSNALSLSLLDPKSSILAFSRDYLKASTGAAELKLKTANTNTTDTPLGLNATSKANDLRKINLNKDRTSRSPSEPQRDDTVSQKSPQTQSTLSRLQNRTDSNPSPHDDPNPSAQDADMDTDSNPQAQSTSATNELQEKLDLAILALNAQRLPAMQEVKTIESLSLETLEITGAENTSILKTVALSEQTQLITPQDPPNEKSLADFAMAMGFDETQIATLFGPQAAQTMISSANVQPNVVASSTDSQNLNATGPSNNASSTLTSALGNASLFSLNTTADQSGSTSLNPLSKLPSTPSDLATSTQMLHTDNGKVDLNALPIQTNSTPTPLANSALPVQLAMSGQAFNTIKESVPLTTKDLAQLLLSEGIETPGVQVSLNATGKAASILTSAAPTSTLAILNMTGSKLSDQAIGSLQKEFNKLKGLDGKVSESSAFSLTAPSDSGLALSAELSAQDQGSSSAHSGNASASSNTGTPNAQASSNPVNMAETYEKLSEQLTAELSKRMHEQISQGQWKMKFALKPSTLGVVDVQLEMKDGKLAAIFQADNALTQNLLQHASQELKDNLKDIGLDQTYVQVDQQDGGQAQYQGQESNARNPFEPDPSSEVSANAQDSSPLVDASMKVKNNDSLLDLMA